jgi:hypothetical protein
MKKFEQQIKILVLVRQLLLLLVEVLGPQLFIQQEDLLLVLVK